MGSEEKLRLSDPEKGIILLRFNTEDLQGKSSLLLQLQLHPEVIGVNRGKAR